MRPDCEACTDALEEEDDIPEAVRTCDVCSEDLCEDCINDHMIDVHTTEIEEDEG